MAQTQTITQLMAIPSGNQGTRQTLLKMRDLVQSHVASYPVIELARYMVENVDQKDFYQEAKQIQEFVRDQIRYVRDPRQVETIQTPIKTLEIGQGDCDDKSILVATMLETLGFQTRFVALAFDGNKYFSHVIVETFVNGQWLPVETTEPVDLGWMPKGVSSRMVIEV